MSFAMKVRNIISNRKDTAAETIGGVQVCSSTDRAPLMPDDTARSTSHARQRGCRYCLGLIYCGEYDAGCKKRADAQGKLEAARQGGRDRSCLTAAAVPTARQDHGPLSHLVPQV